MDRDEFLRQGRGIADMILKEAGSRAAQHEEQLKGYLDAAVGFVDEKTGGRYSEQVGKVAGTLEQGLAMLADTGRDESGPAQPSPTP